VLRVEHIQDKQSWDIPRGYQFSFTQDSKWLISQIRPLYQETRQAKIKKKKPEQMPKDSFALLNLETGEIKKIERVKSFQIPTKGSGWYAFLSEPPLPDTSKKKFAPDSSALALAGLKKLADSIIHQSLD